MGEDDELGGKEENNKKCGTRSVNNEEAFISRIRHIYRGYISAVWWKASL